MNTSRRKPRQRDRVRQMPLPPDTIEAPRYGNWSRMERQARASLTRANRAAGLA